MPTFTKIKDVKLYGLPVEIDGVALSRIQACDVLPIIVGKIMKEAKHDLQTAGKLAVGTFKALYEKHDDRWIAKKMIRLASGHGKPFRNKFYKEDQMGRGRATAPVEKKANPARKLRESLHEAGARNSKGDKDAIKEVIKLSLSQLSKTDMEQTLKDLGIKLKEVD